jgi:hypothetical protein
MSPDDIRQDIELKVVELINAGLAAGTMTEARSKQISQLVLSTLRPGMTLEELYSAIFHLDDNATELSPVVLPYARQYEDNVTQRAAEMVKNYIRVGKYDAAVKLAQDAIGQRVKLSWEGASKP